MSRDFLVYEHWRPDTGVCFYVGKGKKKRARSFEARNSRYGRIVAKLARLGLSPTIKIIRDGLTESEAFALEIVTIVLWREQGVRTANYTNGGDGTSGKLHSAETKAKIRVKAIGRVVSAETRAKMSAARTGLKRSDETRTRQSDAAKIAQKARFARDQKTKSGREKIRRRMIVMSRAAAASLEIRAIRAANAKALWADPEYQEKMRNRRRCVPRPIVKGFS